MGTTVYQKLAEIQKRLFVPKGQTNDFGKYNYRSCEDILKNVKPICTEVKATLFITNEIVNIGGWNYVEATAKFVDLESGETVAVKAQAREEETKRGMDTSQITGACSSYARKYALAGLFCIDNEKDSDATNDHGIEEIANKKLDKVKIETLQKMCEKDKVDINKILEGYKLKAVEDLNIRQFASLTGAWEKVKERYGVQSENQ